MATRRGTPIGDLATALVQNEWNKFRTSGAFMPAGDPPPVQTRGPARVLDYPVLYNTMTGNGIGMEPDSNIKMTFKDLRRFADEHEITRTVIETCKDQLCKMRWTWRLKPTPGQAPNEAKEKSEKDPRVKALNKFFNRPDKEHSFEQWLRIMIEELLVCDTAALWKHERMDGGPYAIRIMDTATIRRLIDCQRGVYDGSDALLHP
jgi:hypothetical protein